MTEHERYLFDLQGYLTVPGALDAEQLRTLNAILDERLAKLSAEKTSHRFGDLLSWGAPYRALLDNPAILPHLDALLGAHPRLDHTYLDIIRGGLSPIGATLHGGGTPYDPGQFYQYRDGRMYNGLVVIAYNLHDVNPGDGGFACVPGSHKANLPLPKEWRDLTQPHPCVKAVTGPAGTAVIFTEALTHGPLPWRGAHDRRTIFFKYNAHCISYAAGYYDHQTFASDELTERQRAMLEAPNARYGGRPTAPKPQAAKAQ
ncbi:MAG: phytanoyl-CoA dioxygenase family protein [Planctomycetes bacterium]|nr:phytanoyl-CoA dioxygenase family protein [Planctomycetota bacterium]